MSWGGSERNRWINSTIRAYWSKRRVNPTVLFSRRRSEHTDRNVELIQRFFSEPPQLIERLLLHGVTANFSISYFHHAKFQILLNTTWTLARKPNLQQSIFRLLAHPVASTVSDVKFFMYLFQNLFGATLERLSETAVTHWLVHKKTIAHSLFVFQTIKAS